MTDVLVGQIGFSVTDALKTAAQAAADPRTQRVAATAANAYYPEQYAQVQQGVQQAKQVLRTNDIHYQQMLQRRAQQPRMMMPMPPPMQLDEEGAPIPSGGPVQHGNLLMIGGLAVAGVVLFLVLRK